MFLKVFLYRVFSLFFFFILHTIYDIKIDGKKNIPSKGRGIIVSNHFSLLDPLIISLCTKRVICWLIAPWTYDVLYLRILVKRLSFIRVNMARIR